MVAGRHKSRTFKQRQVRTPGGRLVVQRSKPRPGQASCGRCGAKLHGIPRMTPIEARHATKSSKRPERPYGGVLCSRCTRAELLGEARAETTHNSSERKR